MPVRKDVGLDNNRLADNTLGGKSAAVHARCDVLDHDARHRRKFGGARIATPRLDQWLSAGPQYANFATGQRRSRIVVRRNDLKGTKAGACRGRQRIERYRNRVRPIQIRIDHDDGGGVCHANIGRVRPHEHAN